MNKEDLFETEPKQRINFLAAFGTSIKYIFITAVMLGIAALILSVGSIAYDNEIFKETVGLFPRMLVAGIFWSAVPGFIVAALGEFQFKNDEELGGLVLVFLGVGTFMSVGGWLWYTYILT